MQKTKIVLIAGAMAVLMSACTQITPGEVGVKVRNSGSQSGVDPTELTVGWHYNGIGESIMKFPTTQKIYKFQADANEKEGLPGGEAVQFTDNTGLQLSGDMAVTVKVTSSKASVIVEKYRKDIDQLVHTEVRMAIRAAVRTAASKYTSEQIYSGAERRILEEALDVPYDIKKPEVSIREHFLQEGVEIVALEWISNINYPQTVKNAITLKTTKLQEAEAAKADEIRANAVANAVIATARGEAESIRLRAEALRNNPEIVQQIYAERSAGLCPPGTQTCIIGSAAWPIVPQGNKNTY